MVKLKPKKSFTLIETVVVIAIIGLIIPAVFSIIFSLFLEQTKIYRLTQVKREGDYALGIIETIARNNGVSIYSGCSNLSTPTNIQCASNAGSFPVQFPIPPTTSDGSDFCFQDKYSAGFQFYFNGSSNSIASNSSVLSSPVNLTSNKVVISNFKVSCLRTVAFSPPVITVAYDICYNTGSGAAVPCNSSRPEETASLHYQSNIQLRSY